KHAHWMISSALRVLLRRPMGVEWVWPARSRLRAETIRDHQRSLRAGGDRIWSPRFRSISKAVGKLVHLRRLAGSHEVGHEDRGALSSSAPWSSVRLPPLDLEPGPGPAAEVGGGLVLGDESFISPSPNFLPRFEAMGGKSAGREKELLASEQGLEDLSPHPEWVASEIAPSRIHTIEGDVDWWRHQDAGVWALQKIATREEVLIEHGDFAVQDQRGAR